MKLPPLGLWVLERISKGASPWTLSYSWQHRSVTASVNRLVGKDFVRRVGDYGREYTVTDRGREALGAQVKP